MSRPDPLGRGWAVPLAPDPRTGRLVTVGGAEKVAQSLWLILDTEPGERVMRPTFGCGLRRFLMMPNSTPTWALIRREVETALSLWEPRVRVTAVRVGPGADPAAAVVEVEYVLVRDGRAGSLVYPFSLSG